MRSVFFTVFTICALQMQGQQLPKKMAAAIQQLESDPQFRHAILSFYVVDNKNEVVFKKNEQTGLVPASCQKILTSVAAMELLGKDFVYTTTFYVDHKIQDEALQGDIFIKPSGDPTFGSWRFSTTKENVILSGLVNAIKKLAPKKLPGIYTDQRRWENNIPNGWIWEDIGNYYGANAYGFNWRENQYDLRLTSGKSIGDSVNIQATLPKLYGMNFQNHLVTALTGDGENAYIYLPVGSSNAQLRGSIGINKSVTISGAMHDPNRQFIKTLLSLIHIREKQTRYEPPIEKPLPADTFKIFEHRSPSLDSINYWFLKKSVNLYGEALVRTMAFKKTGFGSTSGGIELIKTLCKSIGIDPAAINIIDGSGLSPTNRITTHALVQLLTFAKTRLWFQNFYEALPVYNEIKMKSGSMSGVLSYSGYIKSKAAKEYTFSIIVNNFDGNAATVREKIWKLLDVLK